MIIDIYSHACPAAFIDAVQALYPTREGAALAGKPLLFDPAARVEFMDRHGIDRQVLTLVRPPIWLGMPREHMHQLLRVAHQGIADMVAAYPDRFTGVAVAPRGDDQILSEVRYAWQELGLTGVQIFTNIDGEPVDSPQMRPLYAEAASAGQPIWIHPQHNPRAYPWITESLLDRSLAWPFDTALAVMRLAYSGVMDLHPDLAFVTHHLGGVVPYLASRLEAFDEEISEFARAGLTSEGKARPARPIGEYIRGFYGDTAICDGPATLECGIKFFGLGRVAFGTDFPMGGGGGTRWTGQILRTIREVLPDQADRDQVLGETARRLLGLS
jgi:predicted TIM-barrel fold metal-dependent hydrolase